MQTEGDAQAHPCLPEDSAHCFRFLFVCGLLGFFCSLLMLLIPPKKTNAVILKDNFISPRRTYFSLGANYIIIL